MSRRPSSTAVPVKYHFALAMWAAAGVVAVQLLDRFSVPSPGLIAAAGACATLAMAATWFLHRLDQRLLQITAAAQELAAGNVPRMLASADDTLAPLSQSVNRLAGTLAERLQSLEATLTQQRAIAEHGPDAMWVFHVEAFSIIDVNENFVALTGYPREQLIGMSPMQVSPPLQEGGVPTEVYARQLIGRILAGEKIAASWMLRRVDGTDIPCELRAIHMPVPGRTLICGSHMDIRDRLRAQQELVFRTQLENLIMRVSTRMVSLSVDVIDQGIDAALADVGRFSSADRAYVFQFDDSYERVSCTHEWCAGTVEPQIRKLQDLRAADFPWVEQRLRAGQVVHVPRVDDVPDEAASERAEWRAEGIRSLLLVPMSCAGAVIGYVGFDSVQAERTWADDTIALLTIFGELVSNVLERARAERLLREQRDALRLANRELERSNTELQQFAYIASHDLQEPLRVISGFSQLLQKRYEGRLDREADEYIGYIVGSAGRLHRMIVDLLEYSRIDAAARPFERCELDHVLALALANLQVSITELGASVTHDKLPALMGDPSQLMQVLQNLVGNALKFHGAEPPRVHVGAKRKNGHWLVTVTDNGIGIPEGDLERVFQIFLRLHDRERYPGTGIGLAACKRIAERHRGSIEASPNRDGPGTTVTLTLPA